MAKLLVKTRPKLHLKFVQIEKGKEALRLELAKKALHSTLRAALLFWKLLSSAKLQEFSFAIAPPAIGSWQTK